MTFGNLCSKKAATAPRQPTERKLLFKAARGHRLTAEGDDVAAVLVDKLACDGLLHDLLHLEGEAPEGEALLYLGSRHPRRLHRPRPHNSILGLLGMFW